MLTLTNLKVRGFRGFRGDEEFDFASPATLLFGENHFGKSSTLNAVEWALFGDDCLGTRTGIRERVGWEIANRHLPATDVVAEVVLDGPNGTYTICRTLRKSGRKAAVEALEFTLPDGKVLTGRAASEHLAQLLRSSFRDFMTTVYQHQEAIRAVLTQEPRERNDAIDRLLGLSDYRNLLDAIKTANPRSWQKQIAGKLESFEYKVQTALKSRESELNERRQDAIEAGIPEYQHNEKAGVRLAAHVQQTLAAFAHEAGIKISATNVPQTWKELEGFDKATRTEINRLRGELPDLQEQKQLFNRQRDIERLNGDMESTKGQMDEIGRHVRELDTQHGSWSAVNQQIGTLNGQLEDQRRQLRDTNARASLVREAIEYLQKSSAKELAGRCPVCANPAPNLLPTLADQWEQLLRPLVAGIEEAIRSLEEHLRVLDEVAGKYKEWNRQLAHHAERLTERRKRAGTLLGQPLTDRDDPLVLLAGELKRLQARLEELKRAVEEKQARLNAIVADLDKVRLVRDLLQLEEKKKIIERIQESREYKDLEVLRDRVAELIADIEAIRETVSTSAHKEAQEKLGSAEATIDGYFRRLTRHPAITRFCLAVQPDARTGRNSYELTDQNGKDLAPVLSQGDMNALALAMFLGLACSADGAGAFGFVLLDDPSQRLGSDHKEQLVAVLNEVAASKQVVLATMDREFRDYCREGLSKTRTEYLFEDWTPADGPSIRRP
jgi:DNA repair exonuclease SbcCD ATPase subunit